MKKNSHFRKKVKTVDNIVCLIAKIIRKTSQLFWFSVCLYFAISICLLSLILWSFINVSYRLIWCILLLAIYWKFPNFCFIVILPFNIYIALCLFIYIFDPLCCISYIYLPLWCIYIYISMSTLYIISSVTFRSFLK